MDILFENKVKEFVCQLQRAYLVERDIDKVISCMDQNVRWIGIGDDENLCGIIDVREKLEREYRCFPGSFYIIDESYDVRGLSSHMAAVYGELTVQEAGKVETPERRKLCITQICQERDGGFRLLWNHMSAGDREQSCRCCFSETVRDENTDKLLCRLNEQEQLLREQREDLNAFMENVPGGVICCEFNDTLRLLQYSQGFLDMFDYTKEEMEQEFHNEFWRLICPEDRTAVFKSLYGQLAEGKTKQMEYRVRCRDGGLRIVQDHGQLVERRGKKVLYCILTDITESRKLLEELRLSLERHRIITEQTNDIIFEWNLRDDSMFFSDNWVKKFGYYPITENVSVMLPSSHVYPDDVPMLEEAILNVKRNIPVKEMELRIEKEDGSYIWCRIRIALQGMDTPDGKRAIGVISDIDKEKKNVDMLVDKALHDALTGLYNKAATAELGGKFIEKATVDSPCAFIIVDLDNFKYINDVYGHLNGDVLLSDIALLLKRTFRAGDIVGRIGGDEFVIIMPAARSQDIIAARFAQVKAHLEEFLERDGYMLSCSAGVSFAPADGTTYQKLYKNADIALYKAKDKGKNQFIFYHSIEEAEKGPRPTACRTARDTRIQESRSNQTLTEYVFTILQGEEDIALSISRVLEILGRQLGVSRAYIFEDSEDGRTCSNTFEWCSEGVKAQIARLQNIEYTPGNRFDELFDESGVFYCRDLTCFTGTTKEILASQEIESMLQYLLTDKKKRRGLIGFDQCWERRIWTLEEMNVLSMVSGVVGVFLIRMRLEEQLNRGKKDL